MQNYQQSKQMSAKKLQKSTVCKIYSDPCRVACKHQKTIHEAMSAKINNNPCSNVCGCLIITELLLQSSLKSSLDCFCNHTSTISKLLLQSRLKSSLNCCCNQASNHLWIASAITSYPSLNCCCNHTSNHL